MKKCVKVLFEVDNAQKILESFIASQAKIFKVEGIGQQTSLGHVQVFVCGQEELVDEFVDALYVGSKGITLNNINIETCSTERSYRGVFRVVE